MKWLETFSWIIRRVATDEGSKVAGASIHFSDGGVGGKSKENFKIFGTLRAQSRNEKKICAHRNIDNIVHA